MIIIVFTCHDHVVVIIFIIIVVIIVTSSSSSLSSLSRRRHHRCYRDGDVVVVVVVCVVGVTRVGSPFTTLPPRRRFTKGEPIVFWTHEGHGRIRCGFGSREVTPMICLW